MKSSQLTNGHLSLLLEFQHPKILGIKFLGFDIKHGFYCCFKFSLSSPKGKQYNWSKDRAENFYDSDFTGYSNKLYSGVNIGYIYKLLNQNIFLYSGIGYLNSRKYRQYNDSTFKSWSNNYYIKDGSISSIKIDLLGGAYCLLSPLIISIGYSTGTSTIMIGIGYILLTS